MVRILLSRVLYEACSFYFPGSLQHALAAGTTTSASLASRSVSRAISEREKGLGAETVERFGTPRP